MEKGINSKTQVKRLRWFALGCLAGVAGMWAVCQAGLRINGTHSEPVGIYWAVSKPAAKGDLVFVEPPAEPIFKLAKERGYLGAGFGPAGTAALIKQVAAVAADRVTIDEQGVWVNGVRLKNSAPRPADEAGRPLQPYYLSDYTLGSDQVLLMSDYSPASFEWALFRTSFENNDSIGNRAGYNMEIKRMEENQGENTTIEESIDRKLREAEIPGCEVEFDPDEAEKIAFYEDALSDQDARESVEDL